MYQTRHRSKSLPEALERLMRNRPPPMDEEEAEAERLAAEARAEALRAEMLPSRLEGLGVPSRIAAAVSGPLEATPALEHTRRWCSEGGWALLLLGGVGAGKSIAGGWAMAEAIRSDVLMAPHYLERRALYLRAAEAARMLSDYSKEDREAFRAWSKVRLLVLDDLGAERAGDAWLARIDELIDVRYGDQLRTLVTTNLSPEAFTGRYGTRVRDRLRDGGRIVSAGKQSMRGGQ